MPPPLSSSMAQSPLDSPEPDIDPSSTALVFPNVSPALEADTLKSLRNVLGNPLAVWSSEEQRLGVLGAIDATRDMVVIAQTGSGKTMVPILASLMTKNTLTIVAIPLVSLLHDYRLRLEKMRIPFEIYTSTSSQVSTHIPLTLVSADLAVRKRFHQAVKIAHHSKPVGCFIFDEAQMSITDGDYRRPLRNIQEMRCVPAPLVLLTGTAPPLSESAMIKCFGLVQPYIVLRGPTDRPELQFNLDQKRDMPGILKRVLELIAKHKPAFQSRDRVLIFAQQLRTAEMLAAQLACDIYSGNKEVTADRNTVYDQWVAGTPQILVATSALYAGNHYPHIRLVIFAGTPTDMTGTTQGLTRAGRDGQLAHCYILPHKNAYPFLPKNGGMDITGATQIITVCNNMPIACLRFAFTKWNDGAGILCKDSNSDRPILCSSCLQLRGKPVDAWFTEPTSETIPESLRVRIVDQRDDSHSPADFDQAVEAAVEAYRERTVAVQDILDAFDKGYAIFNNLCTLCQTGTSWHPLNRCKKFRFHQVKKLRSDMGYFRVASDAEKEKWGSVCYRCHTPQLPGDVLHSEYADSCEHPDFMMGLALFIDSNKELKEEASNALGFPKDCFATWLGQHTECSLTDPNGQRFVFNFCKLIVWYLQNKV